MASIERSIEVGVPVRTAYNQWTQFEAFPRFMQNVREVRQIDDTHLHWSVDFGGKPVEWDAEITEQVPDQLIAWRGTDTAKAASGSVRFAPADGNRARVTLSVDYGGLGGKNVKDQEIAERTEQDLQRFAQFIEQRGEATGSWRGEVHQGETGGSTGARWFEEAERFAARMASQSLSTWAQPTMLGPRPLFSSFFSTLDTPLQMMRRLSEEMDREVETLMWGAPGTTRRALAAQAAPTWTPSIDVSREGREIVICADLPGVKKEEVSVEIADGFLLISGERRVEHDLRDEASGERRFERISGRFERSIALPEGAKPEEAQASMNDGVLEIRMPTTEQRQRRLQITGSKEQKQPQPGAAGL